jgi:hypothetical protein
MRAAQPGCYRQIVKIWESIDRFCHEMANLGPGGRVWECHAGSGAHKFIAAGNKLSKSDDNASG